MKLIKNKRKKKNYLKNTYEGFFLDNERHGHGVLITYDEDGIRLTKYEGEWLEDKKNGDGVLTTYDVDGNSVTIYQGEWLNDERNGVGVLTTYNDDGKTIYEGKWENDKRNGHGVLTTYDDGDRPVKKYEGDWLDNLSLTGRITFYFDDQECVYHDAEFDNKDPDKILKAKVFIRYFEKIIDDEDEYKIIDRAIMYGTIVYDAAKSQYIAKLVIVGAYPSDIFNSEELIQVKVEEEVEEKEEEEEDEEEQSQKPKRNKLTQDPDPELTKLLKKPELLEIPGLAELLSEQNKERLKNTYNGPIALDNNGKLKTIHQTRWKQPIQPVLLSPGSQSSQESQSSVGTSEESQSSPEVAGGKKTRKRKYQKRKQTRKIYLRRNKRSKKISTKKSRK